jgi:hypothetical protein
MITDTKLVARAEKFARDHRPDEVHPDVAARVAAFTRAKDTGASDQAVQAHARSLMNLVGALAGADVEDVEQIERRRPAAKKSAAKRTAKRTSSRRS